ncbi:MAG: hypothetical protein ACI9WU_001439 [Myxococcota bacterium]|jgi:hypothetical protein
MKARQTALRIGIVFLAAATTLSAASPAEAKLELATKDGKYKARLGGRFQTRLTLVQPGADGALSELGFSIPRARLKLGGTAFTEGLSYNFQVGFGKGKASLKDYFVTYFVSDSFGIRVGQSKMPFSRQQLTSTTRQAMVDRPMTEKAFGTGRDIGLYLLSNVKKSNLEWAVGFFNGTGENTVTTQLRPTIVGRIGYHSDGMKGYSEGDLEGGAFRWAAAANFKLNLDMDNGSPRTETLQSGVDFMIKAHGFSATGGVFLGLTGPTVGDLELEAIGAYAQAMYLIGGVYMPAVSWATVMRQGDDNDEMSVSGGFSILIFGNHNLKWANDVRATLPEVGDTNIMVSSQFEMAY